jgi:DNA-binding GntR family transcriptional regulator
MYLPYNSIMTDQLLVEPLKLNLVGPIPIYQQIKNWIQTQIISGVWPEHYKLKAEADLATQLAVSRGTVRKAMAELAKEGLLVRTHGRGTFVASRVLEQPLAERLITFSEDLMSKGITFETRVLQQAVIWASGKIAARFSVQVGTPLFFLKRLRLVKGEPLIVLHNYVVYQRCPSIEKADFTHYRLFEVLEELFGLKLDYGQRTFQAQIADQETAGWLGLAESDPVMHIEQQTYLNDESLIEFSDLWLRGDQFKLSALVKRHSPDTMDLSWSMVTKNKKESKNVTNN